MLQALAAAFSESGQVISKQNFLHLALLSMLAAPAAAFDLVDAWRAAREFNAEYAAASADLSAGQERRVQGLAGLLPQFNVSYQHTNTMPTTPAAASPSAAYSYGANLSIPLFDLGKMAAYRKGVLASELANNQWQAKQQQLLAAVVQAYLDVLHAQEALQATAASKQLYQLQLKQAQLQLTVGTGTTLDLYEAQAALDGADAKEIREQNELAQHSQRLWRLTGLDASQAQHAGDVLAAPPVDANLAEWLRRAHAHSPELRAAEQALALAKADVTEKRGLHLPVLALSAAYNDSRNPASYPLRQRGSSVGVSVTLPLYAGGGHRSQLREALSRQQAVQDRLLETQRQLDEEVSKAWRNLNSSAALLRAQQRLLASSQNKLASTRLGVKVGIRTNLDLLQAEQAVYDVQSGIVRSKHGYLKTQVVLAQLAGVLDEAELERINWVIRR